MRHDLVSGLAAICDRYGIDALYVFGSRAVEIARLVRSVQPSIDEALSDVDIGILPKRGIVIDPRAKVRLMAELEDLLGVGRIDLVSLPEASPFLAVAIIRGELVYEADADRSAEYELFVQRRAADLMVFERERVHRILAGTAM